MTVNYIVLGRTLRNRGTAPAESATARTALREAFAAHAGQLAVEAHFAGEQAYEQCESLAASFLAGEHVAADDVYAVCLYLEKLDALRCAVAGVWSDNDVTDDARDRLADVNREIASVMQDCAAIVAPWERDVRVATAWYGAPRELDAAAWPDTLVPWWLTVAMTCPDCRGTGWCDYVSGRALCAKCCGNGWR